MRIALFSDNFHPELGGIQDSVEALAKALASRGHGVEFYVPRYSRRDYRQVRAQPQEIRLGENVRINRLRSFPYPSPTKQSRLVVTSPVPRLRLLGARPDLIHTQTFFGVGLEALLAGKLLGIPIVGTNHMAIKAFGAYVPVKMAWAVAYVRWYYNQCDLVTAPSQSVFDDLGAAAFRRPRSVISNPIDTDTFAPAPPAARHALKAAFGLSDATIAYAGRLGVEKNIDTIIRAVASVKQAHPSINLAIAGHGAEERNLRALAAKLDVATNVKFLGTLDKPTLARLFQASELFVIASTSETQSMVLLQAMACGLPVIGARARALPEFIDETRGFTVEPHEPPALAEKIMLLLRSGALRLALGQGGASFARRFSVEAVADQWEAAYHSLIERARARSCRTN